MAPSNQVMYRLTVQNNKMTYKCTATLNQFLYRLPAQNGIQGYEREKYRTEP